MSVTALPEVILTAPSDLRPGKTRATLRLGSVVTDVDVDPRLLDDPDAVKGMCQMAKAMMDIRLKHAR